jgi:hypothetical protein
LDVDDQFGLDQARLQTSVLFAQLGQLLSQRVWRRRFRPTRLWSECLELARRTYAPPFDQMGRVQSFASEQGTDLSGLRTGVGLIQDPQFLGSTEGPSRRFRHYFRVGWARYRLLGNDD